MSLCCVASRTYEASLTLEAIQSLGVLVDGSQTPSTRRVSDAIGMMLSITPLEFQAVTATGARNEPESPAHLDVKQLGQLS